MNPLVTQLASADPHSHLHLIVHPLRHVPQHPGSPGNIPAVHWLQTGVERQRAGDVGHGNIVVQTGLKITEPQGGAAG